MPFRERMKKLVKTKSRSDSLSKTSTHGSDRDRYPSNVYKPGEPMPAPKYKRPPNKEHKEKLESFNFADAWRKKSFQSAHSPMGTRAPSRRQSFLNMHGKSLGMSSRKSFSGRSGKSSRKNSVASGETEKSSGRPREGMASKLEGQPEAEGDDDVGNVGLSRVQSKDKGGPSRPRTAQDNYSVEPNGLYQTSTAHDHQPFSEQDFEKAMHRSHLQVPAH